MEKKKAGVRYDSNQIIWKCVKWFYMNEKIDAFFYEGNIAHRFIAPILFYRHSKRNKIPIDRFFTHVFSLVPIENKFN